MVESSSNALSVLGSIRANAQPHGCFILYVSPAHTCPRALNIGFRVHDDMVSCYQLAETCRGRCLLRSFSGGLPVAFVMRFCSLANFACLMLRVNINLPEALYTNIWLRSWCRPPCLYNFVVVFDCWWRFLITSGRWCRAGRWANIKSWYTITNTGIVYCIMGLGQLRCFTGNPIEFAFIGFAKLRYINDLGNNWEHWLMSTEAIIENIEYNISRLY